MTVPSFEFLLFAVIVAGVFNVAPLVLRPILQLVANAAFLLSFSREPAAFVPFAGFLLFGYLAVRLLQGGRHKGFWALLATALVLFFWLKKYSFVPPSLFLQHPYLTVGLSYVFFRVLHLIIDARAGDLPDRIGVLDYVNYTLDFTCLVAGPIQLYPDYKASGVPLTQFSAGAAVERLAVGFFKVFIVAAVLNAFHKQALQDIATRPDLGRAIVDGLVIVGVYPLYLYANFSGYCDVVIAVARFLHRRLPENFNRPFASKSFIEFWSRWHISLSTWLKTYVYNTLVMSLMRRFPSRAMESFITIFAFFVTFFLVGAWHGQTSEFLFFGVLQGGGVAVNKLYQIVMAKRLGKKEYRALQAKPVYGAVCRGLTFAWFGFTLLWFWSRWPELATVARGLGPAGMAGVGLALVAIATLALAAWEAGHDAIKAADTRGLLASRYARTVSLTAMVAILFAVNVLLDSPAPEIVYKAF